MEVGYQKHIRSVVKTTVQMKAENMERNNQWSTEESVTYIREVLYSKFRNLRGMNFVNQFAETFYMVEHDDVCFELFHKMKSEPDFVNDVKNLVLMSISAVDKK